MFFDGIKNWIKRYQIAVGVLFVTAFIFPIWILVILAILYAIVKWNKSYYVKILIILGIIITWPIWSAVAFVTSASIIAGDKPYCVMVYNRGAYPQREKEISRLVSERLKTKEIAQKIDNVAPLYKIRTIIEIRHEISKEVRKEFFFKVPRYRAFKEWTDLWMFNLLEGYKANIIGRAHMYEKFYAILNIDTPNKHNFYNWKYPYHIFLPMKQIYNSGYPKGDECTPEKYYLFKTLF